MDRVYKKGLSIFLVLLMVLGGISGVIVPSGGTAHAAVSFAGGTGSASDPYQIATADQLNEVRDHLGPGIYFKLTADIDLSSYANWEPIGLLSENADEYFLGNMDGNGFKITNLKIDGHGDGIGLFGDFEGSITNMILEGIEVKGYGYVGGLVGYNNGTISNSSATGSVIGSSTGVGGLVGFNYDDGTISNSYATGSVSGQHDLVGGLVGGNNGTISNSYATGSVSGANFVGGLSGRNYQGTISNSYATGSVTSSISVSSSINVGGLVGMNYGSSTISNSYATGSVVGKSNVGGLSGGNNGTISNSYATGSVAGNLRVGGLSGLSSGTISNSYAIGNVNGNGNQFVGGLVGSNSGTTINHSFYDSSTTGQLDTGKGIGKSTIEMHDQSTFSDWSFSEDWYMLSGQYPQLWAFITLIPGTNARTTKLTGVTNGMEYKVNTGSYTTIVDTSVDNIAVEVGDRIYVRVNGTTPLLSAEQIRSVDAGNIKLAPMTTGAISGVTAPVAGATPVTTIADTAQYIAAITWSPVVNATFAGAETYTARITLKPKAGYTLTGVPANSFTVAGATTTTNEADSGVVIAEFPTTAVLPIPPGAIVGVTAPVTGGTPVATLADTAQYNAAITWSPVVDATFAGAETYTARITLKPKAGYTLTGVLANSFTVAGASTTTNEADAGVVTAEFPATAAIPISAGAIAGVTVPVAGATPVATLADTAQYIAAITWSPVVNATFAGAETYTARITLKPKAGYTLTGVPANSFTVAGATTTTNEADAGVVTAEFPATAALPIATGAIVGVTVPVAGATPVTTIADTAQYIAAITWSPVVNATFAGAETYTARITLKPKAGYTLTGVPANSFTVAGATTTTNEADAGVVTAVFPATTALPIATGAIVGVTAPVVGAIPVTAVTYSAEYTATLTWSPTATLFLGETTYTAKITITPTAGYTLTGVPANFFTVAGATTTNEADSGVVTAVFPATAALPDTDVPDTEIPVTIIPITTAGIAGVPAPVTGATPVTTVTYSAEYTATVSWSPTMTIFVGGTAYTAMITITPKAGYTLTGVPANFFSVAGATTTNAADSGIVMAVFPATQPVSPDTDLGTDPGADPDPGSGPGGGADTGSTFTPPSNTTVTSTNGTLTLPLNKSGEVNFEDAVMISIPVGAIDKELKLTIEKVLDTQKLISNNEILLSPVFEMLKNFPENFNKSVTLSFTFDPTLLKSNQKASVFYYDELKKAWVEIGGKISGNKITVDSNHFTKFAVLAVDEAAEVPSIDAPIEVEFSDITGHWAEDSIKQAVSKGIVKGYLDGTFQPNHTVTRAEFAVMLMNVLKPQGSGVDLTFTDIAKIGAWAQRAIAQTVQAGIITGYEDGAFRPNAEITRAEMAVILAKALGESTEAKLTTSFADDKNIPAWAKGSVEFVKQAGIVQGKGDDEFAPQASATRAEAVTVLLKLLAQLSN